MTRASFLGLLVLGILLTGLILTSGAVLALTIPPILFWIHSLWRAPDGLKVEIRRTLSEERVGPSMPVIVRLSLVNSGGGLEELAIRDMSSPRLTIVGGSNHHLISLGPSETFVFEYSVRGPRGVFPLSMVHMEAGDHTGLLPTVRDVETPGEVTVLPRAIRIKEVPIRPRRTRVYAGTIPARLGGAGVEFFGVRAYQVGDPSRRINWQASARSTDLLFSNEFLQERVADVGIVVDGRDGANVEVEGQSLFEHSVLAAGALADALLQQGNRVGLLVYGNYLQWTLPGYGRLQRERIVHALARAAPGPSQVFEGLQHLPTRLFPSESQLILISPLLERDPQTLIQLRARGYHVMVICPDPVGFAENGVRLPSNRFLLADVQLAARILRIERHTMFQRLRRAGVPIVEWDVSRPFDGAIRAAFARLHRSSIAA